ncbi:MAG: hypothetical protein KDC34_08240 [Saprospiraceae bacterium]|nr:hypothetical protein [Saprospiraceae bacterium]
MWQYILLSFGLFLSACPTFAQQHTVKSDTIPFTLTVHNNLVIQGVLNNSDTVNLMFHTAADAITLIQDATENMSSINWNAVDTVGSWGGQQAARFSESNTLQIGAFTWDSQPIWENEYSGPTTDGKFGPNLFENQVIEINFDKKIIIIHETLPQYCETYEKLDLLFENGFMFIVGKSQVGEETFENRFLIHSGYSGAILYDDQFVETSKIGDHLEIISENELKDSYGNILKTKKAILPLFELGNISLLNIPVGFFEGAIGRQKMSVLGGDVLKRFNIIIDSDRTHIYLKENTLIDLPDRQ